jgi:hypothetical protein
MTPLVSAYDEPTAVLTQEVADRALPLLRDRFEPARQLEYLAFLDEEVIAPALEVAEGDDPEGPPFGFEAQGYARIEHICRGVRDGGPNPERDGYLELFLTFRESGLDSVLWGEAVACRYGVGGAELILDGRVRAHLGDGILFWLDVQLEVDGLVSISGQLDFRVSRERVEVLLPIAEDAHLVYVVDFARGVRVRAANGTFECRTDGSCENEEGDRVVFAELPQ